MLEIIECGDGHLSSFSRNCKVLFCVILSAVREPIYFVTYSIVIACHEYNVSHVDCLEI